MVIPAAVTENVTERRELFALIIALALSVFFPLDAAMDLLEDKKFVVLVVVVV
jgi:hypothetical protein